MVTALAALVVAACVVRFVLCALGIRAIVKLPRLQAVPVPASLRWPRVSVLMPACNEVADLPRALASRRDQDYPDLEVIAIDDRSTDGTAELLDEAAAADPRLRVVHVGSLPEGWLGKVHALQEGMTHATGEWVLLTDADVELAPDTVRKAVAYASSEGLDFVTALPTLAPVSFLVDAAMTDLIRTLLPLLQPDRVRDSRSGLAVGGGAFMLVRRTAYERTPGLQWLRLEVVDDMAFGQMMKASGAQCAVANGAGAVRLAFCKSLRDAVTVSEKAFGSLGRFSIVRLVATVAVMLGTGLAPLVALAPLWPDAVRLGGLAVLAFDLGSTAAMCRACGMRLLPALFIPVGSCVMAALLLRAGWLGVRRGGIVWRGTLYRTEVLRAGMRYRPPGL